MGKLNCKSLMIGDWVSCGGTPIKVENVYEDCINFQHDIPFVQEESLIEQTEIEPIPLTPEILEKNEFVANTHVYPYPYYEYVNKERKLKIGFAFPQGNRTSYKEPWVYIDSEYVFIEHLPCIYVHQLQNAMRLLKIEKEIEL